jgi:hypothetical protein
MCKLHLAEVAEAEFAKEGESRKRKFLGILPKGKVAWGVRTATIG